MSELDRAAALMFPGFKPGGCAPGQTRAAGAQGRGTPPPSAPAPAPTKAAKRAIVKAGEDPALIAELLSFVDGVGFPHSGEKPREVSERLPNPLHLGIVTKTGGTLRGQLRIYSIAGGKVGRVTFKDRVDERDQGPAVRQRMAEWNRRQG